MALSNSMERSKSVLPNILHSRKTKKRARDISAEEEAVRADMQVLPNKSRRVEEEETSSTEEREVSTYSSIANNIDKKGRSWAITIPARICTPSEFYKEITKNKNVRYCCISAVHTQDCKHQEEHFHCLVMFNNAYRYTTLPRCAVQYYGGNNSIKNGVWISRIEKNNSATMEEAIGKYLFYCYKKGAEFMEYLEFPFKKHDFRFKLAAEKNDTGDSASQVGSAVGKVSKKHRDVMMMIKEGALLDDVLEAYPEMFDKIPKMYEIYRPKRNKQINRLCVYIWGHPGTGKSTIVDDFCSTFESMYKKQTWYKGTGWGKWYDGYRYEPIMVMDDPAMGSKTNDEWNRIAAQAIKNILSRRGSSQEAKFSHVTIDVDVCIMCCNYSPEEAASIFADGDKDAILRRFKEGEIHVQKKSSPSTMSEQRRIARMKLCYMVCTQFNSTYGTEYDYKEVYKNMMKTYTVMQPLSTDEALEAIAECKQKVNTEVIENNEEEEEEELDYDWDNLAQTDM